MPKGRLFYKRQLKKAALQGSLPFPEICKRLKVLETEESKEAEDLIDPVNYCFLIIPLKPTRTSHLPPVEWASLRRQSQSRLRRVRSHPLDERLPLNEQTLSHYVVDWTIIARRDAFLKSK